MRNLKYVFFCNWLGICKVHFQNRSNFDCTSKSTKKDLLKQNFRLLLMKWNPISPENMDMVTRYKCIIIWNSSKVPQGYPIYLYFHRTWTALLMRNPCMHMLLQFLRYRRGFRRYLTLPFEDSKQTKLNTPPRIDLLCMKNWGIQLSIVSYLKR